MTSDAALCEPQSLVRAVRGEAPWPDMLDWRELHGLDDDARRAGETLLRGLDLPPTLPPAPLPMAVAAMLYLLQTGDRMVLATWPTDG